MITSDKISASELTIHDRLRKKVGFGITYCSKNAMEYCKQLLPILDTLDITPYERKQIKNVASGAMWETPDRVYTYSDWSTDGYFFAIAGQEIDEQIYMELLDTVPPLTLPKTPRTIAYNAGFLLGEPIADDPSGKAMVYRGFGKKDGRCYYLGLIPSKECI